MHQFIHSRDTLAVGVAAIIHKDIHTQQTQRKRERVKTHMNTNTHEHTHTSARTHTPARRLSCTH